MKFDIRSKMAQPLAPFLSPPATLIRFSSARIILSFDPSEMPNSTPFFNFSVSPPQFPCPTPTFFRIQGTFLHFIVDFCPANPLFRPVIRHFHSVPILRTRYTPHFRTVICHFSNALWISVPSPRFSLRTTCISFFSINSSLLLIRYICVRNHHILACLRCHRR